MQANDTTGKPTLLLKPAEAARTLAVSPRKLWAMTASGEIPYVRIGRCVRYATADLESWIRNLKRGGATNGQ